MIFIVWTPCILLEQKDRDFCGVVMLSEDTETFEFNQHRKSDKTPCITIS